MEKLILGLVLVLVFTLGVLTGFMIQLHSTNSAISAEMDHATNCRYLGGDYDGVIGECELNWN